MKLGVIGKSRRTAQDGAHRGFTLLELIFVVMIGVVITAMAIPLINNVMGLYRLRSAVASVTGAIQTTRYQAISNGIPYQVVFSTNTGTYQIQNDPTFSGNYVNVGGAIPLASSSLPVVLGTSTTLRFRPSGIVTASVGSQVLTLTYGGKTETITVSSYGNVKVTP